MASMYDYIYEEETVLINALKHFSGPIPARFNRLFIVGCGSSFNCGKIAEPFILNLGLTAAVLHPVEFMATQTNLKSDDLVVLISQVGNSALVVETLRYAKGKCVTLGLTSNDEGIIAAEADHHINIGCGEEDWNAKSKGVSATVLSLLLLALHYARDNGLIGRARFESELGELKSVVGKLTEYTEELEMQLDRLLDLIDPRSVLNILATGNHYAVAREFAMKVTECAYIKAAYQEIEEYLHGFEMAADGSDVFVILALDQYTQSYAEGVKNFLIENGITDRICIVGNRAGDIRSSVPDSPYSVFVGLAFLQLTADALARKFGIDHKETRYKNIGQYVKTKLPA